MTSRKENKKRFPIGLILVLLLIAWGAASVKLHLPPASWFLPSESEAVQDMGEDSTAPTFPDKPPFRFGSRTLSRICKDYGLDAGSVVQYMEGFAIKAKPEWTIKHIAAENDMETEALFEVIRVVAMDQ